MGYPQFFTLAAIALARICSLNPVLPAGQDLLLKPS